MPELPELNAAADRLREHLVGRRVERLDVSAISVLRTAEPPVTSLVGRPVTDVTRRGKHLLLDHDGRVAVLHLALAGWLRHYTVAPTPKPGARGGPLAARWVLDDGSALDVTEQGHRKSVALWISDRPVELETLARLGPEADALTLPDLAAITGSTASHVKTVLTDQRLLAGIGNAWSDEILWRARLSPFAAANRLGEAGTQAVFDALRETLHLARDGLHDQPLDRMKRTKKSLLQVHGRAGETCPRCGGTIAEVSYASRALQYCPTCQTGGRRLNDRRMDRLLR